MSPIYWLSTPGGSFARRNAHARHSLVVPLVPVRSCGVAMKGAERPEAVLPGYLMNKAGELPDQQIWVTPAQGVGCTDEYFEVFVMPNGVRMTCEPLPER